MLELQIRQFCIKIAVSHIYLITYALSQSQTVQAWNASNKWSFPNMCDLIFVAHPLKTEFYFVFPVTCLRREGGLCKKGFQVPCMDGFSVCQCFRIFSTFSPDSFLRLVTHSFIFSGVIFFNSTSLLLPPTKGGKEYIFSIGNSSSQTEVVFMHKPWPSNA